MISKLISSQGFTNVELIGKGAFGLVFKANNVSRKEIVALKVQYISFFILYVFNIFAKDNPQVNEI